MHCHILQKKDKSQKCLSQIHHGIILVWANHFTFLATLQGRNSQFCWLFFIELSQGSADLVHVSHRIKASEVSSLGMPLFSLFWLLMAPYILIFPSSISPDLLLLKYNILPQEIGREPVERCSHLTGCDISEHAPVLPNIQTILCKYIYSITL